MITIDFLLSPAWRAKNMGVNLASADNASLRYEVLLGDIIFKTGQCDLSAKWDWIPLIDFATSLRQIVDELIEKDGTETIYEFTESDATLEFKREGSAIIVSASYAPCHATVPLVELAAAIDSFSRRILETISREFPSLLQNKILPRLLPVPLPGS